MPDNAFVHGDVIMPEIYLKIVFPRNQVTDFQIRVYGKIGHSLTPKRPLVYSFLNT
jgi:hypothetical protein